MSNETAAATLAQASDPMDRSDVPWSLADFRRHPVLRWAGIGTQFDEHTGEIVQVAVDDTDRFVARHGLPCTDERAAEIAEREWDDLQLDAGAVARVWWARNGD